MVKPVFLDFDFSTILSADYTAVKGAFEQPIYKDEGIILPKSYCFENTTVFFDLDRTVDSSLSLFF